MDARHKQRIEIVQSLFSREFHQNESANHDLYEHSHHDTVKAIYSHLPLLDNHIRTYAPKYPVEKLSKVDVNILRLALFELLFEKKHPTKVVINEAVDLAKELGNERSYAFVNAVLGSFVSAEMTE